MQTIAFVLAFGLLYLVYKSAVRSGDTRMEHGIKAGMFGIGGLYILRVLWAALSQ